MNKVSAASVQLKKELIAQLSRFPRTNNDVQGYSEYNFLGFSCSNPISLQNLLGPKFSRNFDSTLQMTMNELKENNALDKAKLHGALLEKYLGISKEALANLQVQPQPNAYASLPAVENDDYYLHLFFLQPFRLYGLTEQNRRFIRRDLNTGDREWLWRNNGCDSAPLFRKIIQIYLLSEILQDYDTADSPFRDEQIAAVLPQMEALRANLLTQIPIDLQQLLTTMTGQSHIAAPYDDDGDPRGLLDGSPLANDIDVLLPGFMDIASLYPIGRLLFGQPNVEPHHNLASRGSSSKIGYIAAWLYTHLNLSTSIFWVQVALNICKKKWKVLRDYVTDPQVGFGSLVAQSLLFIPNAFILASTPLLILIPSIYGVTSIPFSLFRSLVSHGPRALRSLTTLKFIDTFELIKDGILFYFVALPLLNSLIITLNLTLPAFLLSIGGGITGLMIFATLIAIRSSRGSVYDADFENAWSFAATLASTNYFRFMGTMMALGATCYVSLGVVARHTRPYIPAAISNVFFQLISTVTSRMEGLFARFANAVGVENNPVINLNIIIPTAVRQPSIVLPKARIEISPAMAEEAGRLYNQLAKVNQLLNLSEERKKIIGKCLKDLDTDELTSLEALQEAIKTANNLLRLNFTADEATTMETLARHLSVENPDMQQELNAFRDLQVKRNNGSYQPSWKMITMLHEKGIIGQDRQWHAPAGISGLTPTMLEKCEKISDLKHRATG